MITKVPGVRQAPSRALAALAVAAALTIAGCGTMSPIQTDVNYQSSDGVSLNLGDRLDVRGIVVVGTTQSEGPGRVVGQFVNGTSDEVKVTFGTTGATSVSTEVPAHGSVNLAEEDGLTFDKIGAKAGDLLPVTITTDTTGDNVLNVPVLPAEGFYADYAPAAPKK